MKINGDLFEEFWSKKGQYLRLKNANRLKENLIAKINELGDTASLDEYVRGLRTGKESTRQLVVKFYHFIEEEKSGKMIDSSLFDKKYYDYPFERQLEIAKFLHEKKTPADIQNKFDIDNRTVRNDLQELEEGIQVLGAEIKIEKEKKGRSYYYKSTLHPIFLPLNLTEVYAMTVYLDHAINKNDPNAQMIHNISLRIKNQLSDYAYDKLFHDDTKRRTENYYRNDEKLAHEREGIYMYLMKTGKTCRVLLEDKEYIGQIVRGEDGKCKVRALDDNNQPFYIDIDKANFIVEALDYE